jgi:hypothetical protein
MPTLVYLGNPASAGRRAKKFSADLFGWNYLDPPGYPDYFLLETRSPGDKPAMRITSGN